MTRDILFMIRDPTEIAMIMRKAIDITMAIGDMATKKDAQAYSTGVIVTVVKQASINPVARMTIGAMSAETIGEADPYKLREISNAN